WRIALAPGDGGVLVFEPQGGDVTSIERDPPNASTPCGPPIALRSSTRIWDKVQRAPPRALPQDHPKLLLDVVRQALAVLVARRSTAGRSVAVAAAVAVAVAVAIAVIAAATGGLVRHRGTRIRDRARGQRDRALAAARPVADDAGQRDVRRETPR